MEIANDVKQAVLDNGARPIGIFPTKEEIEITGDRWKDNLTKKEKKDLIKQIKICDGIILQGGNISENYECIIAKYAYYNNIPILEYVQDKTI